MSIFTKAFEAVKNFASHLFSKIAHGDKDAADQVELTATNVVTLINNLKAYLNGPLGDVITMVIPGDWDGELRKKASHFLEVVITKEAILHGCLQLPTLGEQIACIYSKIEGLGDKDHVDTFWHKLGVLGMRVFSDGHLSVSDSIFAIEFGYQLLFKKDISLAE